MINNSGFDRRKNIRYNSNQLPDSLKELKVSFDSGITAIAKTIDMSKKGLGLSVPLSTKDITDIFITISTLDQSITKKEQILSTRAIDKATSRVNIMFLKINPFFEYVNKSLCI